MHLRNFGETEIEYFRAATAGNEKVGWFDVAMNNSLRVRRVESIGNFNRKRKKSLDVNRTVADSMLERRAFQVLHRDERLAALLPDVVNRAYVRVIERGCRLRFSAEAAERLRISGDVVRQEFKRDEAVQARVPGFINHAHASAAQLFNDVVMGDCLADEGNGGLHRAHGMRASARESISRSYCPYYRLCCLRREVHRRR